MKVSFIFVGWVFSILSFFSPFFFLSVRNVVAYSFPLGVRGAGLVPKYLISVPRPFSMSLHSVIA